MLLSLPANPSLRKIVVLNPKGGSGKSTLAVNLAGYLAESGRRVALMDFDPQQSAMQWLGKRASSRPEILGIPACKRDYSVTRSFQYRIPRKMEYLVVDSPAAVADDKLLEYTHGSHAILVPVMPSSIDTRAASKLISSLLLKAKVSRSMGRLGIVVNRARAHTIAYRKLNAFLERLGISAVTALRDSQKYVRAGEQGISIHEMRLSEVRDDLETWLPLIRWLEGRLATKLTPRDLWPLSAKSYDESDSEQQTVLSM